MNNLQSLFEKIKIDASVANLLYIYYSKEDGSIHKISPKKEKSDYDILEVEESTAKSFLTGEKKTGDYKVSFDIETKTISLKNIHEKNSLLTYDKILFQIPKNKIESADLTIIQDLKNSFWNIYLDNKVAVFLTDYGLSLYDKILLSVTEKDDPNILKRSLYIDLGELVENPSIIPFKFDFEFEGTDVSIYTSKYLNSYNYKVVE